jgi:hypothetical protein
MPVASPPSLTAIANLLAGGALAPAARVIRQALEAEPRMRMAGHLARLHREVIQHQGAIARVEREAAERRIPREVEQSDRARLTAFLLELLDEMARLERDLGIAFRVDTDADREAANVGRRADTLAAPAVGRTDVFLSYARPDRALIVELAVALEARGCACWFDHFIAGGERFREAINARIDTARAVVALWSEHSVKSDWVIYEADRAHKAGKLVPLRMASLAPDRVPAPYPAVLNILVLGDDGALTRTLKGFGLLRQP